MSLWFCDFFLSPPFHHFHQSVHWQKQNNHSASLRWQSHWGAEVGMDLWRPPGATPEPLLKQGYLLAQGQESQDLWRGRLLNCFVPALSQLHGKVVPDASTEPPACQFVPTASCLGTENPWKEPSSLDLFPSIRFSYHTSLLFPSLLFIFIFTSKVQFMSSERTNCKKVN